MNNLIDIKGLTFLLQSLNVGFGVRHRMLILSLSEIEHFFCLALHAQNLFFLSCLEYL